MKNWAYISLLVFITMLSACDKSRVFEQNKDLKDKEWYIDSVASFSFEITDNTKPNNLCFTVRNTVDYPFCNLYIRYYLLDTLGRQLASRQTEMFLMEPKTGKPLGKGLGDIFEHIFVAESGYKFPYNGRYVIKMKQYMRENPLKELVSIGVRIEKVEEK